MASISRFTVGAAWPSSRQIWYKGKPLIQSEYTWVRRCSTTTSPSSENKYNGVPTNVGIPRSTAVESAKALGAGVEMGIPANSWSPGILSFQLTKLVPFTTTLLHLHY